MVENFLAWVQLILLHHPFAAPILFIGVHTLMAVCFVPCSPMTLIAGALWGGAHGLVVSITAALVSSATTFILSRSFLHGRIEKIFVCHYPKIAGLWAQIAVHDWKIIALAQLNPLIPASTMGYAFGLSRVTFTRYLLFSGLFMLPLQALFVTTGHSVTSLLMSHGQWKIAVALVLLVVIFSLVSQRIYKKLCQLFGINHET